jgi:hypothetical protein
MILEQLQVAAFCLKPALRLRNPSSNQTRVNSDGGRVCEAFPDLA